MSALKLVNFLVPLLGAFTAVAFDAPSYAVSFQAQYRFPNGNTNVTNVTGIGLGDLNFGAVSVAGSGVNSNFNIGNVNTRFFSNFKPASTNLATSLTSNDFFAFSVAPALASPPNFTISLSSISLDVTPGSRAPNFIYLLVDQTNNGFSAADLIGTLGTTAGNKSFDVSSIGNITGTTNFRIYGSGATGGGGFLGNLTRSLTVDNLVIDGNVTPVPYEFETAAGLLVFGGYFAGKRYLKNKAKVKA